MKNIIVTLGCSWVYGIGAGYSPGQTKDEYLQIAWDPILNYENSFRGILCKKYNATNINMSAGASSNQAQFRLAEEFFGSTNFSQTENVIVIWGITSTSRNDLYSAEKKGRINVSYNDNQLISKILASQHYDHDEEVLQLSNKIRFWDKFFNLLGIKHIWFDAFNHHNYDTDSIKHFVNKNSSIRDMLSTLNVVNNNKLFDNAYHKSNWTIDSDRVDFLVKKNILNPYTLHPTILGHQQIADILTKEIDLLV